MKLKMIAAATLLFSAAGLAAPSLADKTTFVADCTKGAVTNLKTRITAAKSWQSVSVCMTTHWRNSAKKGWKNWMTGSAKVRR